MKYTRFLLFLFFPLGLLIESCVTDVDGYSEVVLQIIDTLGGSVIDEPEEVEPNCFPDENITEFNSTDYEWDDWQCDYDSFDDEYTLEATTYWSNASFNMVLGNYPENGVYYTSNDSNPASDEVYIYIYYPGVGSYHTVEGDSVFIQKYANGEISITFCDILLDIGVSYMELYGNVTYDGDNCD